MVFKFLSLAFVGAREKRLPRIYIEKIILGGVFAQTVLVGSISKIILSQPVLPATSAPQVL